MKNNTIYIWKLKGYRLMKSFLNLRELKEDVINFVNEYVPTIHEKEIEFVYYDNNGRIKNTTDLEGV